MQVDKLDGNRAWIGKKEIQVDSKKRLTSARLRRLMCYALAAKTPVELSTIRDFIDSQMEDGEFFTQGQLAGVVKNMLNSKELVTLERGIYQAGPEFDKRASVVLDRPPYIPSHIPAVSGVSELKPVEESAFAGKRSEILRDLELAMRAARLEVNGATVSELSDEDFTFIREFRQLDKMVQEFCGKYKNDGQ